MKKKILIAAALLILVSATASTQCLLTFQTEVIPAMTVGQQFDFQIEAVSGTEPYHFSIFDGAFPQGIHMTPNGRVHGKPKTAEGTVVFITVTDDAGCQLTQAFDIQVNP